MASTVNFSGRDITVKTLTVREVKELLEEIQQKNSKLDSIFDLHVVDLLIDDEVPAAAVSKATGLSLKELEGEVDPAEVKNLIDEVRALNPFFVGMMERLVSAGKGRVEPPSSRESAP